MFGPANCWTGTTGQLSHMVRDLLRERENLLAVVERLQRDIAGFGFVSQGYGKHDIHKRGQ